MEEQNAQLGEGVEPESDRPEMSSGTNTSSNMETLLKEEGLGLELPQTGDVRTGVIASISDSQILVSVGAKSEGSITGRELEQIPPEERAALHVGQEIPVYIMSTEDSNGIVVLSYTRAQEQKGWDMVEEMMKNDEVYSGVVDGYNKGGLIVPVHGLRGFIPASQIGISRRMSASGETPEKRWGSMMGESIQVRVIEVDRTRRRLILSERAASNETRQSLKERVIDELKEGEIKQGRVTSLADFGAFVNINGADGLVHLSEISWEHIRHPSELLEVGQEVSVKVINIDREKKRIGLSLRALIDDPYRTKIQKFKVGQLIEGVITRLTKFGAFARIEGDIEGLIHISEISESRIEHPKEYLKEGDVVTLRIIRIDPDQRRIGLSLRKVDSGAYKDMDLANIKMDLEDGVNVQLAEGEQSDSTTSPQEPESTEQKEQDGNTEPEPGDTGN